MKRKVEAVERLEKIIGKDFAAGGGHCRAAQDREGFAGQGRAGQGTGYEGGRGAPPLNGSQSARVASAARSPVLRGGSARRLPKASS